MLQSFPKIFRYVLFLSRLKFGYAKLICKSYVVIERSPFLQVVAATKFLAPWLELFLRLDLFVLVTVALFGKLGLLFDLTALRFRPIRITV